MSDLHDHAPDPTEPQDAVESPSAASTPRDDPRNRPPDPAGTQPRWNDEDLLPKDHGRIAPGSLWGPPAPPGDPDDLGTVTDDRHADAAGAGSSATATTAADAADDTPRTSRFSPRFQFVLGALMAVAAAAIVLFVAVVAGRDDHDSAVVAAGPSWSAWHPAPGADGAAQIAEHVARQYRSPKGKQLVAVTGGPLQIAGLPVTVAMRETVSQGGDIKLLEGNGVLYRMCGLGKDCAIKDGKPSTTRGLLLQREALELALYSFRYLGVSDATVLLPPAKGEQQGKALFFRRDDADLQQPIAQPLDATLVQQTPTLKTVRKSPDAQLVQTLTGTRFFTVSFTQANMDARAFMVLEPLTGP